MLCLPGSGTSIPTSAVLTDPCDGATCASLQDGATAGYGWLHLMDTVKVCPGVRSRSFLLCQYSGKMTECGILHSPASLPSDFSYWYRRQTTRGLWLHLSVAQVQFPLAWAFMVTVVAESSLTMSVLRMWPPQYRQGFWQMLNIPGLF